MSRFVGILSVLLVLLLAIGFAHANAGHQTTLSLGILTLYRVPVTLVAFLGLFVGMLVMFATGIHSDLKVRRILRERLAEESRQETDWIDRNQQDLFHQSPEDESGSAGKRGDVWPEPEEVGKAPAPAPAGREGGDSAPAAREGSDPGPEAEEVRDAPSPEALEDHDEAPECDEIPDRPPAVDGRDRGEPP
jgi:uncharacterized integral membrane protein